MSVCKDHLLWKEIAISKHFFDVWLMKQVFYFPGDALFPPGIDSEDVDVKD